MNMINQHVLIVGSGYMAREYGKVLKSLEIGFFVVGRSSDSCMEFERDTGIEAIQGGIQNYLNCGNQSTDTAIVCTSVEQLASSTMLLIRHGFKNILVEKPAGLSSIELEELLREADSYGANLFVGYNRRFYTSTLSAMDIIKQDGGVSSFHFEFTEWSNTIAPLPFDKSVKNKWLFANSSHVIDLAFFLGGKPVQLACFSGGELSWSECSSVYTGAGITELGSFFSYCANWNAPGRWSVEALTKYSRLYFKPMEKLQIQKLDSVQVQELELDDRLDMDYKPGLYRQIEAFLGLDQKYRSNLIGIKEQLEMMKLYERIAYENRSEK